MVSCIQIFLPPPFGFLDYKRVLFHCHRSPNLLSIKSVNDTIVGVEAIYLGWREVVGEPGG